jgi:hypothetical protein
MLLIARQMPVAYVMVLSELLGTPFTYNNQGSEMALISADNR